MSTQEVIDKYFQRDGRTPLYFHGSDKLQQLNGASHLLIEKSGIIELWLCSERNGDVCVLCTNDGEKLETMIKLIIN